MLAATALAAAGAGCGSDESSTSDGVTVVGGDVPDRHHPGAEVFLRSGCLACHRIGRSGNDGPGPRLTRVGARLDAAAIARVLVSPRPPMPSFQSLPRSERRALVEYLAARR